MNEGIDSVVACFLLLFLGAGSVDLSLRLRLSRITIGSHEHDGEPISASFGLAGSGRIFGHFWSV